MGVRELEHWLVPENTSQPLFEKSSYMEPTKETCPRSQGEDLAQAGKGVARDHWEDGTKLGGGFPRGIVLFFKLFCMLEIFHNYQLKKKSRDGMSQKEPWMESGVLGPGFSYAIGPLCDLSKSQPSSGPQGPVSSSPSSADILLDGFHLLQSKYILNVC